MIPEKRRLCEFIRNGQGDGLGVEIDQSLPLEEETEQLPCTGWATGHYNCRVKLRFRVANIIRCDATRGGVGGGER